MTDIELRAILALPISQLEACLSAIRGQISTANRQICALHQDRQYFLNLARQVSEQLQRRKSRAH
jgi:hypothetical protein